MRRTLILIVMAAILSMNYAMSQKPIQLWKNYFNLSYVIQKNTLNSENDFNTKFGVAFTFGHTFYLNEQQTPGKLMFGIDVSWLDANYGYFSIKNSYEKYKEFYDKNDLSHHSDINVHMAELGIHFGPSLTWAISDKFSSQIYAHYEPSFAALSAEGAFAADYGSFFITGLNVSYNVLGFGFEKRWGGSKYKAIGKSKIKDFITDKIEFDTSRIYVQLRF